MFSLITLNKEIPMFLAWLFPPPDLNYSLSLPPSLSICLSLSYSLSENFLEGQYFFFISSYQQKKPKCI